MRGDAIGWRPASRRDARVWWLAAAAAALWVAAAWITPGEQGASMSGFRLPSCPLRTLTGVRCPLCGITTGCAWMARGEAAAALRSNLLSPLAMGAAAASLVYLLGARLAAGRRLVCSIPRRLRQGAWALLWLLLALSWIRNLFAGR